MPRALIKQTGLLDTWGRRNRIYPDRSCRECGELFKPKHIDSKYCSRQCRWKNNGKNQGQNIDHETWWLNSKGYIIGRVWRNGKAISIRRARWIMEQHLGRPLSRNEIVHHRNGNKTDDRKENFEIKTNGGHTSDHQKGREHKNGYKLNLSEEERQRRRSRLLKLWADGRMRY